MGRLGDYLAKAGARGDKSSKKRKANEDIGGKRYNMNDSKCRAVFTIVAGTYIYTHSIQCTGLEILYSTLRTR